jgi:hypothetical protein
MTQKLCPHCGWKGTETKREEWLYCVKHGIKVDDTIKDANGKEVLFCRMGMHIPNDNELKVSDVRSQYCPKCGGDWLMDVPEISKDRIETIGKVEDYGFGMMTPRVVLSFGDGFNWVSSKGKVELPMLPIFPVNCPVVTELQLKKGDKFRVIFERI